MCIPEKLYEHLGKNKTDVKRHWNFLCVKMETESVQCANVNTVKWIFSEGNVHTFASWGSSSSNGNRHEWEEACKNIPSRQIQRSETVSFFCGLSIKWRKESPREKKEYETDEFLEHIRRWWGWCWWASQTCMPFSLQHKHHKFNTFHGYSVSF